MSSGSSTESRREEVRQKPRLYESVEYPLARAGERTGQPNDLSELRETPMKVRPHSRAVVKRIEAEDKIANGIIISPNAGNK